MAALWRALNAAHEGPELLFLLHAALFWCGLACFAMSIAARRPRLAMAAPLVGLLPFVFNYLGLLWKDVALVAAWTFAAGIVALRRAQGGRLGAAWGAAAWAALAYGALVRVNTLFAAAPLALWLFGRDASARPYWRAAAALALTTALILAAHAAVATAVRAERQHPMASLIVFDLVGASPRESAALLPGAFNAAQRAAAARCYTPARWDSLGEGACAFLPDALDAQGLWGGPALTRAWLAGIAAHPGAYLGHRLAYMNALLRWRAPAAADWFMLSEMRDAHFAHRPNALFAFYRALCERLGRSPLFRPYVWLLLDLAAAAMAMAAQPEPQRAAAAALSLSGALYLLTYAVVGVGSDFRYAYWSIVAALLAWTALAAARWSQPRMAQRIALGGLVVLAAAVATSVWR